MDDRQLALSSPHSARALVLAGQRPLKSLLVDSCSIHAATAAPFPRPALSWRVARPSQVAPRQARARPETAVLTATVTRQTPSRGQGRRRRRGAQRRKPPALTIQQCAAGKRHVYARSVVGLQFRGAEILCARSIDPLIAHDFEAESLALIQTGHSCAFESANTDQHVNCAPIGLEETITLTGHRTI